ncbi:GyrI-like domain-containing protein [Paracerasibacillus soli]
MKPYLEYMQPFTFRSFAHKQLGYHLFYDIWMDALKYMDLIHNSILMAVIDEASTYMVGIKLQPQCNGEFYSGNMYYSVYHYGQIESIKDTYIKMYQHWIPQNGLKVKQGAVLEIYEKHRPVKISIPIERSSNVVC